MFCQRCTRHHATQAIVLAAKVARQHAHQAEMMSFDKSQFWLTTAIKQNKAHEIRQQYVSSYAWCSCIRARVIRVYMSADDIHPLAPCAPDISRLIPP